MIAILLGSFFSTGFYQYYSRDGAQVKKKHSKRKLQILNADFSPQFQCILQDSHGLKSCVLCEKHASETQDAQVKKSLHIVEIYETDYNCVTHLIRETIMA